MHDYIHKGMEILLLLFINISFLLVRIDSYTPSAIADQVAKLPGWTKNFHSNQFSGYLNVSSTRFIHYYYFESENDPETDSVVFWTNGGPGCSGLLGLFTEFGPWRPQKNGTLARNPSAWTSLASIVFLEQPAGVGFSYSTNHDDDNSWNDYKASKDNLMIIKQFFQRFPERANNDFYLASESYGGHYIPQWTLQILGDESPFFNHHIRKHFKGFLVGNPYTSYASGPLAMANVLWGLQLIPGNR
eukprot:gene14397-19328_t